MKKTPTTEFRVKIDGITLPKDIQARISNEIQNVVKREIANADLKGDVVSARTFMPLGGKRLPGYFPKFKKQSQ